MQRTYICLYTSHMYLSIYVIYMCIHTTHTCICNSIHITHISTTRTYATHIHMSVYVAHVCVYICLYMSMNVAHTYK